MPAPTLFPGATGWRRVLLVTTTAGFVATLLGIATAALISGSAAAASAGTGGGAVVVFSFISLALIDWSDRHAPQLAIPLFMAGFVLKVAALAVALPALSPGEWLRPDWAIGTGVAVLIIWQAAEILSFARMRIRLDPEA